MIIGFVALLFTMLVIDAFLIYVEYDPKKYSQSYEGWRTKQIMNLHYTIVMLVIFLIFVCYALLLDMYQ